MYDTITTSNKERGFQKMKKNVNSFAVAIVIVCGLLCSALIWFKYLDSVKPEAHEIYPTSAIVTDVSNDKITITDFEGRTWIFYADSEDWAVNDICAVIMDDNGTPETVYDDLVIQARYCGYVK